MSATAPATSEKLLTAEEYLLLPDDGQPTELVRGRVVTMNVPNTLHGWICAKIARIVGNFVEETDQGRVTSNDSGVVTERNPDTVRGADVAFYSYTRLPKESSLEGYSSVAPDVVFEVKSPSDRWKAIVTKLAEYLNAGVQAVCVADPEHRTEILYRPDEPVVILRNDDELTFPSLLPGFVVKINRFFG
jgi:Uma2 family endonuclease